MSRLMYYLMILLVFVRSASAQAQSVKAPAKGAPSPAVTIPKGAPSPAKGTPSPAVTIAPPPAAPKGAPSSAAPKGASSPTAAKGASLPTAKGTLSRQPTSNTTVPSFSVHSVPTSKESSGQSSSPNIGFYIGVAITGVVVVIILSFAGYCIYQKYLYSKYIPTPGTVDMTHGNNG
ncbi:9439_t:CDS:2 [Racocetra persica]|uniref:9439_t:CDS:1 n=1 Tax=Racocetra persica TaxID=160502 RepID=A0ACA9L3N1_9GLOM|nr:9439_t:CDS:2 [Racocetra persica]